MDEKCELASAIVDYVWSDVLHKITPHTVEKKDGNGDRCDYYVEQAQDIFNNVLDIIDDVTTSEIDDVVCRFGVN